MKKSRTPLGDSLYGRLHRILRTLGWGCAIFVAIGQASASTTVADFSGLALDIPDDNASGVSDTRIVDVPFDRFASLRVFLNITGVGAGGYNGDLYVTLTHGSGYSVLLNRVGRRADNLLGYSDDGVGPIVLSDTASLGDIHNYREAMNGSHSIGLSSSLFGTWQPDGRATDPDHVMDTDSRTAMLDSLESLDPNGSWTIFAADLSAGGELRLENWGLEFFQVPDGTPVVHGWLWFGCLAFHFGCGFGRKRGE